MQRLFLYLILIISAIILCLIYYKAIKPNTFKIKEIIPIFIFFGLLFLFDLRNFIVLNEFTKNEFQSKIINSFEWRPKVTEFTLENKIKVSSSLGDFDLQIGDSIVKSANTTIFDVYRKDYNNTYVFYKRYDYSLAK